MASARVHVLGGSDDDDDGDTEAGRLVSVDSRELIANTVGPTRESAPRPARRVASGSPAGTGTGTGTVTGTEASTVDDVEDRWRGEGRGRRRADRPDRQPDSPLPEDVQPATRDDLLANQLAQNPVQVGLTVSLLNQVVGAGVLFLSSMDDFKSRTTVVSFVSLVLGCIGIAYGLIVKMDNQPLPHRPEDYQRRLAIIEKRRFRAIVAGLCITFSSIAFLIVSGYNDALDPEPNE